MGYLDKAKPIQELGQGQMWVVYGKSGTGKTHFLSTFPKPILYLRFGDDGSNTIAETEGILAIEVENIGHLNNILDEALAGKGDKYSTIACDTFSLIVNEWADENAVKKKKRMSQQMWGDLKTDAEEAIKKFKMLAKRQIVALTCHQITDSVEGMEGEILPDVRPSLNKSSRTYIESMANYGIHLTVLSKEDTDAEGNVVVKTAHAAHIAPNQYYWTKLQKPAHIKVPEKVINPTYTKIVKIMNGGTKKNGNRES